MMSGIWRRSTMIEAALPRLGRGSCPGAGAPRSLALRPATDLEITEFEEADVDEEGEEDAEDDDSPLIMFLVDVTDPDDEE